MVLIKTSVKHYASICLTGDNGAIMIYTGTTTILVIALGD